MPFVRGAMSVWAAIKLVATLVVVAVCALLLYFFATHKHFTFLFIAGCNSRLKMRHLPKFGDTLSKKCVRFVKNGADASIISVAMFLVFGCFCNGGSRFVFDNFNNVLFKPAKFFPQFFRLCKQPGINAQQCKHNHGIS